MEYFDVGKIVNTHGIKGEVRVHSLTNHPEERYSPGSILILFDKNNQQIELSVRSHRKHKTFDLITFEGLENINDVEDFVGGTLKVSEEDLLDLDENEYYLHEIVGCKVIDEEENHLGSIKDILFLGSNDVWVVQRQGKKDLLLPYIDSVILDVNIEDRVVTVHVLEGLDD